MIDRRRFVAFLTCACLQQPLAASAQRAKPVTIGLLIPETELTSTMRAELEAFRAGLREQGWIEGRNIVIETRWAGSSPQRQRELAAQLKSLPVAVVLALGTTSIASARDGAPGIPVVMINAGDPVGSKFVTSLAKPGGNLTGTSAAGEEVLAKQVELLTAAVSGLRTVGVLMNRANPANGFFFDAMSRRAASLGVTVDRIEVTSPSQLDGAVARAKGAALIVVTDPMFLNRRVEIAAQALRARVPTVFGRREYVEAGGLMSYVSSPAWHWRSAAIFVDRILKGANPADIPVEQPTKFELVINMKTARALGIAIPRSLLQFADDLI